jgi:hypothetical protein
MFVVNALSGMIDFFGQNARHKRKIEIETGMLAPAIRYDPSIFTSMIMAIVKRWT